MKQGTVLIKTLINPTNISQRWGFNRTCWRWPGGDGWKSGTVPGKLFGTNHLHHFLSSLVLTKKNYRFIALSVERMLLARRSCRFTLKLHIITANPFYVTHHVTKPSKQGNTLLITSLAKIVWGLKASSASSVVISLELRLDSQNTSDEESVRRSTSALSVKIRPTSPNCLTSTITNRLLMPKLNLDRVKIISRSSCPLWSDMCANSSQHIND